MTVADLFVADLFVADLFVADLFVADLFVADLFVVNLSGADLDGATGLDTAMGLVDEPVLAVASSARCITSTRAARVPAASPQSRFRYADTV